ncbi:putative toxin-antitoxin system toxin component, PIN family [Azospirillum halopraeferens]|uniref:putative toxin-antitoxin system toxin component, PIN family n=1 Tax=Azospirillum halopraeferens TaxID=34010 RepID=UPI00041348DD|nr:putative toxin-antitoxin system toxin component, PIN family [Azospirillum halopraeferens]
MRCILDTNVLVGAALLPDPVPQRCLALDRCVALARRGTLLFSAATLEEVREVLRRPVFDRHRSPAARDAFLDALVAAATLVEPTETPALCRDPDDDKFLALALAADADALVTQDRDLLVLRRIGTTPILHPDRFVAGAGAPARPSHTVVRTALRG